MTPLLIQLTGYLASVLLALSLMVTNDLKFRWLNTFGCVAFIVYGLLIGALPVLLTNSFLLIINIVYLVKIYNRKEAFSLVPVAATDEVVQAFVAFYKADIATYFPSADLAGADNSLCFLVLRDMAIANLFAARITPGGDGEVTLNYTIPRFRDYKVGRFIFEKERHYLTQQGVQRIVYKNVANKNHEEFLQRMGFEKQQGGYMKNLTPSPSLRRGG